MRHLIAGLQNIFCSTRVLLLDGLNIKEAATGGWGRMAKYHICTIWNFSLVLDHTFCDHQTLWFFERTLTHYHSVFVFRPPNMFSCNFFGVGQGMMIFTVTIESFKNVHAQWIDLSRKLTLTWTLTCPLSKKIENEKKKKKTKTLWCLQSYCVWSNMSRTRASASSRVPNTERQMKTRGNRPSAFICFEVFGTRDEVRSPVFYKFSEMIQ